MNLTIYEKIEKQGLSEVDLILEKAREQGQIEKNKIIKSAEKENGKRLEKVKSDYQKEVQSKERLLDLEQRQAFLTIKQEIIESIFDDVLEKIEKLEGKELLDYVATLIKKEEILGDEIIYTNRRDYDKYLKALSTNKAKQDLVELDLLNKKLNTNLKLSNEPVSIKSGFILEGKYFDLNFSYEDIIKKLREEHEKDIAKELFG